MLEQLEDRRTLAANPLTIDLGLQPNSSSPRSFAEVNNVFYFSSSDGDSGQELWRSDGTAAGTWMVKDLNPSLYSGSYPNWLTNVNGTLFFAATDVQTSRTDLWKSDGTAAGTVLVDSAFGSADPAWLTNVGGTLYFSAVRQNNANNIGVELWKSDGTQAGTVVVKDIVRGFGSSSPTQLVNVNGTLYFTATTSGTGTEVWKSDGTAASTVQVRDIAAGITGSNPRELLNVGGTLYFTANNFSNGYELWKSNGTSASTVIVRDINAGVPGSYPRALTEMNGLLFFTANGELWKSAGTSATTVPVEVAGTGSYSVDSLINANGTLFFSGYGPSIGFELWKSDGTAAGTSVVQDIAPGFASSSPSNLQTRDGKVYFTADPGSGVSREIFASDGTNAGTFLLKDIDPTLDVTSNPAYLFPAAGRIFFVATEPQAGRELWATDGTVAGTSLVKDIQNSNTSADIRSALAIGTTLYFANGGSSGVELWKTDGTLAGTVLVKDIAVGFGSSYPSDFVNVGGTLYFTANDGINGRELWKSNGTAAGTVLVRNIAPGSYSSSPRLMTAVGSTLYFVADDTLSGAELWKSSGTSATTVLVKDIVPGTTSSYINSLVALGSSVYFTADDGVNGREVWKSNGTAAGTVIVKDIAVGASSYPTSLTVVGSTLYFVANDGINGTELWKSNGTVAGTVIVKNLTITPYESSYPTWLTNVNGVLYFAAREPNSSFSELFRSDGTVAGTVAVEGADSLMNNPEQLINVGGTLYFRAFSEGADTGVELWKSNGTAAGTTLVKDVLSGPADANISQFFNVNGQLILSADLPGTGRELWKSDGTAVGTTLLSDLRPGILSSDPQFFNVLGSKFVVIADDGTSGRELMVFSGNQAPAVTVPAAAFLTEDFTSSLTGISVSDPDANVAPVEVTLSVAVGTLSVLTNAIGGVKASDVTGNGTATITLRATTTAINATLSAFSGLVFTPPPDYAGPAPLSVTINDLGNIGLGGALSASGTMAITVVNSNDPPQLTVTAGPVNYTENGTLVVDPLALVSDIDSLDFATGILSVSPGVISASDRVSVRNQGSTAGLIGLSGSTVTFGGVTIGTVTSGSSGGTLAIALNASATPTAVQALLRNITFRTVSDNPVATPRSLIFSLNDGDGVASATATTTVNVTPVNDGPTLSLPGAAPSFVEDAGPVLLDATAVVNDLDDNLVGGSLTVTVASGGSIDDRFDIQLQGLSPGQISTSPGFVLYGTASGPVVLGTYTGSSSTLVVTFTSQVSIAGVQALVRSITFQTLGDTPLTTPRVVTARITDGAGGSSALVSKTITVTATNDDPRLIDMGSSVSYTENAVATILSTSLNILDIDSADFNTGVLAVSITANGTATDLLEIRNQGNAAGQIGVSGANVSFGGVLLGTFTGGAGLTPLVVTLNGTANVASVSALMRNITFRNSSEAPSALPRTVQFQISDGDGGASLPLTQSVTVVSVNDRPVVSGVPATATYVENAAPLFIAPSGSLADVDSPDFQAGSLTIRYTSGATADDRLTIESQGFGAGQIGMAGLNVLFGGINVGTISSTSGIGTTQLQVILNANANVTSTRAILRRVAFSNVSDTPATAPRVIQVLLNDGDGATSLAVNQTLSLTAVNDAPTLTLSGSAATYSLAGPAVDIDNSATLTDVDSTDLAGGVLTINWSAGGTVDDVLAIRNEGSGAGQIGIVGSNVTFGGIVIGTFAGGTSNAPLVITLNTAATPTAAQALARKITFSISGTAGTTTQRTITFQITDGDGGTSALVNKLVNVTL